MATIDIENIEIVKGSSVLPVTNPTSTWLLGLKTINGVKTTVQIDVANMTNQLYASTDTIPPSSGFYIYNITEAGTYNNFLDINGDPIVVSQEDIDNGLVQIWVDDNVSQKITKAIEFKYPILDTDFFT